MQGGVGSVTAGDFSGDGITDLVVAANGLFFVPGLGGGKFGTPVPITGAGGVLATADFNHDGKLDLADASFDANTNQTVVTLLLGNGDGTFRAGGQWTTPYYTATALYVADFNADGNPDLLLLLEGPYGNAGVILFGDGRGNLTGGPYVPDVGSSGPQLAVADVNGDGVPDVLIPWAPSNATGVLVLLGNGDGTFRRGSFRATAAQIEAVVVADVNGDGKPDLAALTYFESLILMYGNGDGTFNLGPECFAGMGPLAGSLMGLATLSDPTGSQGFAVSGYISPVSYYQGSVTVLRFKNGKLASPRLRQTGFVPFGMVTADFNHDGKLDLATAAPAGLAVLLGNGDGTFQKPVVSAGFAGYYPIAVADFNHDGIPDVMVSGTVSPFELAIFLGNGDGTFRPLGTTPILSYGGYVSIADLNGDGIPDAVTGPPLTVYLGNGDGTFGAPISLGYNLGWPFVFADFNGDGKLDLAVNYPQGRYGYVLLGNGDGTFSAPLHVRGMGMPAAAADLNGDGIPDLAGYTSGSNSLAVAFGHGDGTFSVPQTYPLQPEFDNVSTVTIADWNGDGHLDIAAMPGTYGFYTYFFLGDGKGHFTAQPNGILLYPMPLAAVGDFNGDGLPDVASAGDAIWVLRNTSR